MTLAIRIVLLVLGLGLVAGLGAWGYRTIYDAGLTAGRSEVQAKWDADKLAQQRLIAQVTAENAARLDAATKLNQETIDGYKATADAAVASADLYARRLHDYENRPPANAGSVPASPGQPGADAAAAPPGQGQLERAVAARLAECDANEAELTALQVELAPQLEARP